MTDSTVVSEPGKPGEPEENLEAATPPETPEQQQKPALVDDGIVKRAAAELLGTFILIFIGIGGIFLLVAAAQSSLFQAFTGGRAPVGLLFGLTFVALSLVFGHVSGAHFNPVLSLTAAIAGRIRWLTGLIYIVAQVIGAFLAALVLFVIFNGVPLLSQPGGPAAQQGGASADSPSLLKTLFVQLSNGFESSSTLELPVLNAGLVELIAAAILAAVFLAAYRPGVKRSASAVAVGLAYAGLITVLVPLTGAGLNPARSTATVLWAGEAAFGQLWLFWVAPLVGAVLAGLIYRGFINADGDKKFADHPETVETVTTGVAGVETDTPAVLPWPGPANEAATEATDKAASTPTAAEQEEAERDARVDPQTRDFFDQRPPGEKNS